MGLERTVENLNSEYNQKGYFFEQETNKPICVSWQEKKGHEEIGYSYVLYTEDDQVCSRVEVTRTVHCEDKAIKQKLTVELTSQYNGPIVESRFFMQDRFVKGWSDRIIFKAFYMDENGNHPLFGNDDVYSRQLLKSVEAKLLHDIPEYFNLPDYILTRIVYPDYGIPFDSFCPSTK